MDKIYVSQLFSDEEVSELLSKRKIGVEIIDFGIGMVLDKEDNGLGDYLNRMGDKIAGKSLSLHGPFLDLNPASFDSLVLEATKKRYNQVYSIAKKLGADRIVFHSCYLENIYYKDAYVSNSIKFWNEFLADKDDSIEIHIENVYESEMDHLIEIIDGVGNKKLSICLDIGHVNCYSKYPPEEWIEKLGCRIGHFHLNNNDGIRDSHQGLRNGSLNIDNILKVIKKHCANSSMTFEISDFSQLDESIEVLNRFFDYKI